MEQLPSSIIVAIAILTVFLMFITALKYAVSDDFTRTRLIMTAFFLFIVATLTISFRQYAQDTLPYTVPAFSLGLILGYFVGVRTAEERLKAEGLRYYTKHFAHIHWGDLEKMSWWSVINFYSIMSALVLINLVGLSTVIFRGAENWAIATSTLGALLIGTTTPYLAHIWSIKTTQNPTSTSSER